MEFERTLYSRRSVRAYTNERLDEAAVRRLINAAIQAPSAVNEQPWIFSVVRDRDALGRIDAAAKAHALAAAARLHLAEPLRQMLADPAYRILCGAPALIVISSASESPWAVVNCALAAQNLMLAARDVELGSCWIGFAQDWLTTPEGKAAIGAPADCLPVAPIIVGHPEERPSPVLRNPPEIIWIGG